VDLCTACDEPLKANSNYCGACGVPVIATPDDPAMTTPDDAQPSSVISTTKPATAITDNTNLELVRETHGLPMKGKAYRLRVPLVASSITGLLNGVSLATLLPYRRCQGVLSSLRRGARWEEMLITFLLLPPVAAGLAALCWRARSLFPRLIPVAYLTAFLPLLGLGIADGSNPIVMTVGGGVGGTFWGLLLLPVLAWRTDGPCHAGYGLH